MSRWTLAAAGALAGANLALTGLALWALASSQPHGWLWWGIVFVNGVSMACLIQWLRWKREAARLRRIIYARHVNGNRRPPPL